MTGFKPRSTDPEQLRALFEQSPRLSYAEIAERMGVTKGAVRHGILLDKLTRPVRFVEYDELRRLWEEGVLRDDADIARYYGIRMDAAAKRRQRAGIKQREPYPPRTTPEKLALALILLRDEEMSYLAAAEVADLPPRRLAEELPGYGWSPEKAGAMRNLERQLDRRIEHAWPAYADKHAAA